MSKDKNKCSNECNYEMDYYDYECDCNCSTKSKLIKIGACVGGIALLGGIIATLIIKNKRNDY